MNMRTLPLLLLLALPIFLLSCQPPLEEESNQPRPEPRQMTEFEREIMSLKTADFDYIYVLRRKDGEMLTNEDKEFIRANRHHATNRSSLSTDEKVVYIGSNFAFEETSLAALKERFAFEDFSKPAEQIEKKKQEKGDGNSNVSANANN